jgi:hypothetical protein
MTKDLGRFSVVVILRSLAFVVGVASTVALVVSLLSDSGEHGTVVSVMGPPRDSCIADTQSSKCYDNGDRISMRITTEGSNVVMTVPVKLGGSSKPIDLPPGTYSVTSNLAYLGSIQPSSFTVPEGGSTRVAFAWPAAP